MTTVRRVAAATMVAMTVPVAVAPVASASPSLPGPPYVEHVEWAKWGDLSSLRVFPTESGRLTAGQLGTNAQADAAWSEVLTLSPDADIPGMKTQFICHWHLAEFAQPGKLSWNLEPWRPEVDDNEMLAAGCNPGGTEEPF
jgi:hypothetical protein